MKKILLILLIGALSFPALFAEDDPTADMDMAAMLEMLSDNEKLEATDISDFQELLNSTEMVEDDDGNPIQEGALILETINIELEKLVEDGTITQDIADTTKDVVVAIETATPDDDGNITLGAALDDSGTSLDKISDGIVGAIATMAVEQALTGDGSEDLQSGIRKLKGALGSLSEFGQANALTSVGGSLFGYQGYKLFAFSLGTTMSIASDMDTVNTVLSLMNSDDAEAELETELENDGFAVGVSIQGINASIGINLSWLVDRLYVGAVFGATNVEIDSNNGLSSSVLGINAYSDENTDVGVDGLNASISTNIFGLTANYQLIKPFNVPILFRWNGVSVGSGFIYTGYNINAQADISSFLASDDADIDVEPGTFVGVFEITSNAVTIPLEISTGIRVLSSINLSLGLGADIQIGSSNVSFDLETNNPDALGTKILTAVLNGILESEGMSFPYNNPGDIQFINPKAMVGIGIGLGPLTLLDLSVTANVTPAQTIGLVLGANLVVRW